MPNDSGFLARGSNGEVAALALAGLRRETKTLPAKLFYDEEGCRLFYRITELPEYYLTRTERALLAGIGPRIAADCRAPAALVEYGASSEDKARSLLEPAGGEPSAIRAYVPVDVAAPALSRMKRRLARTMPHLLVAPVVADFLDTIALPDAVSGFHRLGFFPGSTIGNLEPEAAVAFLRIARATLGEQARFLVGADLRKDPALLLAAYDDSAGVTAAFNRNLLVRLNREADANFDPDSFAHRAIWNAAESRIEMHLVSQCAQAVRVAGRTIRFAAGESIHTENSYKHTAEAFIGIAARAGWACSAMWTDPARWFGLYLLSPA